MSDVVFGGKFRLASNNYTVILAGRFVSVEVFQGCEKAPAVLADKFVFAMLEGLEFPPVTPTLGPFARAKVEGDCYLQKLRHAGIFAATSLDRTG